MVWLSLITKYKRILSVLGIGLLFGSGWYLRGLQADSVELKLIQKHNQELAERKLMYSKLSKERQQVKVVVQEKEKVVIEEVIKYVKDPTHINCVYDSDRMRIKQDILRTADTRTRSMANE